MIAISAIMITNILQYIRKILHLKIFIRFYLKLLNFFNITYNVTQITSFYYKNNNFLILLKIGGISNTEKTMIFVNSVEKNIELEKYLQFFLLYNLKNKGEKIIVSFLSLLEAKTKTDCLKDFYNSNIKI